MSGHSKWAQIKHKKATSDQQRGRTFSKLGRAITIAARGNPDPKGNARLRTAIEAARRANMPSENIERAIARVSEPSGGQLQELRIEILMPGNIAFIVTSITDNKNRTMGELRVIIDAHHGRLVEPGSLSWMFDQSMHSASTESDTARARDLFQELNQHDDVQGVTTNVSLPL